MKTIKELKGLLFDGESNTLLGMHLNTLFPKHSIDKYNHYNSTIHDLDEKIEVIAQMFENDIDAFKDSYKLGSVTRAFYQVGLKKYNDYK